MQLLIIFDGSATICQAVFRKFSHREIAQMKIIKLYFTERVEGYITVTETSLIHKTFKLLDDEVTLLQVAAR